MGYRIAVVGATGNVGREVLAILAEREFPCDEVVALASSRSIGKEVSFGEDEILKVQNLEGFDFKGFDLVFLAAGSGVSAEHASKIAKSGAIVIDKTSHFRLNADVPLIVPEVNKEALQGYSLSNIISNPNCVAIPLVMALKPLHDFAGLKRVVISTYQSVSGAGHKAMDELFSQTRAVYVNDTVKIESFTKQIAFNVIPHIDSFRNDGQTGEEWKIASEVQKILGDAVPVFATCVRVPVFIGHAMSVAAEFDSPISVEQARNLLKKSSGIGVIDHRQDEGYVTPQECAGDDLVYVSRIRQDPTVEHGLGLWVVADNLRKGAALNAVQIAESLIELL